MSMSIENGSWHKNSMLPQMGVKQPVRINDARAKFANIYSAVGIGASIWFGKMYTPKYDIPVDQFVNQKHITEPVEQTASVQSKSYLEEVNQAPTTPDAQLLGDCVNDTTALNIRKNVEPTDAFLKSTQWCSENLSA